MSEDAKALKRVLGALETNETALMRAEQVMPHLGGLPDLEREAVMAAIASTRDARDELRMARSMMLERIG